MSLKVSKKAKCLLIVSIKDAKCGKLQKPEKRTCEFCGSQFLALYRQSKFCSTSCRRKSTWQKRKEIDYNKKWDIEHKAERRTYRRRHHDKVQRFWYEKPNTPRRGEINHTDTLIIQSERMAETILREEGFKDLLWTRNFSAYFPCDYLAKKGEECYAIEVTTQCQRMVNKRILPLLQFFGLKLVVLHIKPDMTEYYLKEVEDKMYSSAETVIMEKVRCR